MAFDVSGLANYTEQNKMALITKAVFGAKTISLMTPMVGVKSSETINILDTDAVFQAGGTCGFNPSGTTAITQRVVTVGKIKVHEALCPKTLEAKYTQTMLQAGSQPESIPFEKAYTDLKTQLIQKQMEIAVWQGDTTSGNAALNKFDGLLKLAGNVSSASGLVNVNAIQGVGTVTTASASPTVTGVGTTFVTQGIAIGDKLAIGGAFYLVQSINSETSITLTANAGVVNTGVQFDFVPVGSPNFATPYTAFTVANSQAIMQSIVNSIPVEILDSPDVRVFIGVDWFRTWATAITNSNLFHYTADSTEFEMVVPGTSIKVIGVNGLNGTNRALATRLSNMFFGTDLMNEEEKFKIFFAEEADEVRYMAEWKAGVNFAFLNEVAQFTLAA